MALLRSSKKSERGGWIEMNRGMKLISYIAPAILVSSALQYLKGQHCQDGLLLSPVWIWVQVDELSEMSCERIRSQQVWWNEFHRKCHHKLQRRLILHAFFVLAQQTQGNWQIIKNNTLYLLLINYILTYVFMCIFVLYSCLLPANSC